MTEIVYEFDFYYQRRIDVLNFQILVVDLVDFFVFQSSFLVISVGKIEKHIFAQ